MRNSTIVEKFKGPVITPGDYLDTSNPYRLSAFFKFLDAANMARTGIDTLQITSVKARNCMVSVLKASRQQAIERAFEMLNGGEVKAIYPPSWPRKT